MTGDIEVVAASGVPAVGLIDDLRVEMRPWGFDPASITVPTFVWQGGDDSFTSLFERTKEIIDALVA